MFLIKLLMCFFIHICWGSWFSVFLVDYILLLFILMFKLFFIWPTRAHSCWLLCPCSHHSLSMSLLFVTGICSGLILYCSCLILESAISLGILDPFTGEWHLEAKISVPVCLLLLGCHSSQAFIMDGAGARACTHARTPIFICLSVSIEND